MPKVQDLDKPARKKRSREDDDVKEKRKKSKKARVDAPESSPAPESLPVDDKVKDKKKKKSKKSKLVDDDPDAATTAAPTDLADGPVKEKKKKSKKAKVDADPAIIKSVNDETKQKQKKPKDSKKSKKSKIDAEEPGSASSATDGLLPVDDTQLDPALSSLFATTTSVLIHESLFSRSHEQAAERRRRAAQVKEQQIQDNDSDDAVPNDEELSELESEELEDATEDADMDDASSLDETEQTLPDPDSDEKPAQKRRRKAKDADENLEANYLNKLSKQAERDGKASAKGDEADDNEDDNDDEEAGTTEALDDGYIPPQHESLAQETDEDFEKAQRTVFLGNVSTEAIKSKSARKTLETHLKSFFTAIPAPTDVSIPHALSSLRFRSTPFASAIPKRAAFAKKEVMDATTQSTNAYAVYSSSLLAREAAKRLNGTTVLSRHLRVDSVAHPAKTDHRRCVFVGNLGFVDDETLMDAASHEKRKGAKVPSDVEEGLWRTFAQAGPVDSVRVVRDPKTRVGKGIAYVQFADETAVEAALLLDGRRFPPMLPRKLRVSRAKAVKRNRPAPGARLRVAAGVAGRLTPDQQTRMGRAARLLGKAAAAGQVKGARALVGRRAEVRTGGFKAPEDFVFEGNRAKSGGKSDVRMRKGPGKKALPTKSGAKRGAAWKSKQRAKA